MHWFSKDWLSWITWTCVLFQMCLKLGLMPSDISLGTSRFLFFAHFLRLGVLLTLRFLSCTQIVGFSYTEDRLARSKTLSLELICVWKRWGLKSPERVLFILILVYFISLSGKHFFFLSFKVTQKHTKLGLQEV